MDIAFSIYNQIYLFQSDFLIVYEPWIAKFISILKIIFEYARFPFPKMWSYFLAVNSILLVFRFTLYAFWIPALALLFPHHFWPCFELNLDTQLLEKHTNFSNFQASRCSYGINYFYFSSGVGCCGCVSYFFTIFL